MMMIQGFVPGMVIWNLWELRPGGRSLGYWGFEVFPMQPVFNSDVVSQEQLEPTLPASQLPG